MKNKSIMKRVGVWLFVMVIELLRVRHVNDCGEAFFKTFWFVDFKNSNRFLQSLFLIMLPQVLLMFFWGDYFEEMIYQNASILLPRVKNVAKIMKKFYVKLIVNIIACLGLWGGLICVFCAVNGTFAIDMQDVLNLLLYILYMIHLLLFMNFISVIEYSIIGTMVGVLVQTSSLMFISILFEHGVDKLTWMPAYIFLLCQRENMVTQKLIEMVYLLFLIGLFFVMNCFVMKRKEWRA